MDNSNKTSVSQNTGLWHKLALNKGTNSLSLRMLSYILICSTLLALIITLIQLRYDYKQDVEVIEESIDQIEVSFLQPIARRETKIVKQK
jgi:hypothetical protein